MASLIINKLRTVGKNIYQKEIDRVCSALIKELDDQMGSIYNPLSVFLNPAEMNLAITEAKEEAMIT